MIRLMPVRLCDLSLETRMRGCWRAIADDSEAAHELVLAALFPSKRVYWVKKAEPVYFASGRLSNGEVEVMQWVACGLTAPQVALVRGCGAETVKSTLAHARRKLGAKTTTEAVAISLRRRLLPALG